MSAYEFPAWVKYDKNKTAETTVTLELSKQDLTRLRAVLTEEDHEAFYRCDVVADIYNFLHSVAVYEIADKLHEIIGEEDKESRGQGDKKYSFYIDFPYDLK